MKFAASLSPSRRPTAILAPLQLNNASKSGTDGTLKSPDGVLHRTGRRRTLGPLALNRFQRADAAIPVWQPLDS